MEKMSKKKKIFNNNHDQLENIKIKNIVVYNE